MPASFTTSSVLAAPAPPRRELGAPPMSPERPPPDLKILRGLTWIYLLLWVTEGALRKWIFPTHATPLLIVRDPVLFTMYLIALQKGIFPRSAFIPWIAMISGIALVFSLIGSRAPFFVQLYGFRADFLHLPLIFLIPNIFNRADIVQVGKWFLLSALPMSFLVLLQFKAPATARVNTGVGGEGAMLEAGYGHIRASGTFSFTNGLTGYTALIAAFCAYGLLEPKAYPRWLRMASLGALASLILLSASRGVVGMVIVVLSTVVIISLMQPRYLVAAGKITGVGFLAALTVGSFAVFRDGLEVFAFRFGNSANVREGFIGRFFGSFATPFQLWDRVPFYGVGLGMGTNVGAGLIFQGERRFLFAESELGRVMFESGPLIGPLFILLRVAIVMFLFAQALRTVRRDGHPLAMLLFGACAAEMLLGTFGQATTLGFVTIVCGLCLAANRQGSVAKQNDAEPVLAPTRRMLPQLPMPLSGPSWENRASRDEVKTPAVAGAEASTPAVEAATPPAARGRSLYAEQMLREAGIAAVKPANVSPASSNEEQTR